MDLNVLGIVAFQGLSNQIAHISIVAPDTNKGNEWSIP